MPTTPTLINPGKVSTLILLELSATRDKVDPSLQIQTFLLLLPSRVMHMSCFPYTALAAPLLSNMLVLTSTGSRS